LRRRSRRKLKSPFQDEKSYSVHGKMARFCLAFSRKYAMMVTVTKEKEEGNTA
jgi:hypothetical protein